MTKDEELQYHYSKILSLLGEDPQREGRTAESRNTTELELLTRNLLACTRGALAAGGPAAGGAV